MDTAMLFSSQPFQQLAPSRCNALPPLQACRFSSGRRLGSTRAAAKLRLACSATAPAEVERSGKAAQQSTPDAAQGMPPKPSVKIDNQTDPFATVVSIKYGNKLGELLDTTAALRNLGLNIRRAKVARKGDQITNKFYITEQKSSEKIVKSARLQEIQATIFSNLMLYHPEAEEELGWGARAQKPGASWPTSSFLGPRSRQRATGQAAGDRQELPARMFKGNTLSYSAVPVYRSAISTMVQVLEHENGDHSEVFVETADRAGLLTTIVQTLKDLNVNVVAAEVDTEGSRAIDKFYVTYHGEPLNSSMVQLVTNTLQYTLSLSDVEKEESY